MSIKKIKTLIAEQMGYDISQVASSMSLFDDLEMNGDDFDLLVQSLEEMYEIELDYSELDDIETISDLADYIKR